MKHKSYVISWRWAFLKMSIFYINYLPLRNLEILVLFSHSNLIGRFPEILQSTPCKWLVYDPFEYYPSTSLYFSLFKFLLTFYMQYSSCVCVLNMAFHLNSRCYVKSAIQWGPIFNCVHSHISSFAGPSVMRPVLRHGK
jgi:hypothetical protein